MSTEAKPSIYLYPITPYTFCAGANDYIIRKSESLSEEFEIINSETSLGILDVALKFFKTDILYFNWIEDLADKRLGFLQVGILYLILLLSKVFNKKVIWFVHNNCSHYPKNQWLKKQVRNMMESFADKIFSHSNQPDIIKSFPGIACYDHPIEKNEFVSEHSDPENDILIWGSQTYYKGTDELVQHNKLSQQMQQYKMLIAGKFCSDDYFKEVNDLLQPNITIINKIIEDEELVNLFKNSRYVLFCYRKNSVLSSGALSKSLSYGKTVIGPNVGAFKELAERGLVYTYNSFEDLSALMQQLISTNTYISKEKINDYVTENGWHNFSHFLVSEIKEVITKRTLVLKETVA